MLAALFAWIAFAIIVGVVATTRGRAGYGWFLVSLVLSPLIVGPLVLALPCQYAQPQTATGSAILKWFGITILFGLLVVVAAFVLALVLIVQHGGA
jgi:hypothetical protein